MTLPRMRPWLRQAAVPLLMAALAFLLLREPLVSWLQGDDRYDQEALAEWIREARVHQTLPELVDSFLQSRDRHLLLQSQLVDPKATVRPTNDDIQAAKRQVDSKFEQIEVHMQSICDPITKVYPGRLPLFVTAYRLEVRFDDSLHQLPVVWDSGKPRQPTQYRELAPVKIHPRGVWVEMQFHSRVYARQQLNERLALTRWRWLSAVGLTLGVVAGVWLFLGLRRQRQRESRRLAAEQQANAAERRHLQEALRREEAERRQQEAERTALELKSQLFANIGIMAGSYAHNIKNLLVRPNDLLGRCLENDGLSGQQTNMLQEVRQTLGTVTERLQQILQTVRRDPSESVRELLDFNGLVGELCQTWRDLARDKWKLDLTLDLEGGDQAPLWISGDRSHLQQTLENLLFNARDATFEMRNLLREQARKRRMTPAIGPPAASEPPPDATAAVPTHRQLEESKTAAHTHEDSTLQRRHALIAAAAWRGQVWVRTRREAGQVILQMEDNGIGMSDEVRRRCIETHFSTKRNNALFAGFSAGMGLGLSFVAMILHHHQATMHISSQPGAGAQFRVAFPEPDPRPT